MTVSVVVAITGLFLAGLLAGEELVIRVGVRAAIDVLGERAHIELRQALIGRLRVFVPAIYGPTAILAVAVTVLDRGEVGFGLRCLGVLALLVWIVVTLGGTVPINEAAFEWDATAPPSDWRSLVERWERLNTIRTAAAVAAFACLSIAVGLQLAA